MDEAPGLPTPEVLLESVRLREAEAGLSVRAAVLEREERPLLLWLEERLSRGEESVTLELFCGFLEKRGASRDEGEEAFGLLDSERAGVVRVEDMKMALKSVDDVALRCHVLHQLWDCSLAPGFVDIFSKSNRCVKPQAAKILKYLHRNRIPSSAIPFPGLTSYNTICTMRSSVVRDFLDRLLQKDKVVDSPEAETAADKSLREEAVRAILNGAAIFHPDKQTRRDELFHMMENQPESVKLTFESLCKHFSDPDPRGLLLLPPRGAPSNFDITPILTVMDTLLTAATRECDMLLLESGGGSMWRVLLSLFWSLQGSLLSWCFLQLKGGTDASADLAREILIKYVEQFLVATMDLLSRLVQQCSASDITEKLSGSILAMATRQLMIFLLELCALDIPHCLLLKRFRLLAELLKKLSSDTEDVLPAVRVSSRMSSVLEIQINGCWQDQQLVVLRTWHMESSHVYESHRHETTVFVSPGATCFEVEFDERCNTMSMDSERFVNSDPHLCYRGCFFRDYLEFTDASGETVRYSGRRDQYNLWGWPKKVTFKAGPRLQFLFHSDRHDYDRWGYKFTVTAYGPPDATVSWTSDLQLLVARLMGRLASRAMALKSPHETRGVKEPPAGVVKRVLSSPLWKPVFFSSSARDEDPAITSPDVQEVSLASKDEVVMFLKDFANWDPSEESNVGRTGLLKALMLSCKKRTVRNEMASGSKVDQAVNATWAAMVYHTPALHHSLQSFVAKNGQSSLSDDLMEVYSLADGIRVWMRHRTATVKEPEEQTQHEVTMESLADVCIGRSLFLFRFRSDGGRFGSGDHESCAAPLQRSASTSEGDHQACSSPSTSQTHEGAGAEMTPERQQGQLFSASVDVGSSSDVSSRGESLPSQTGEPASPLVLPCKAGFSGSEGETSTAPLLEECLPILKHILHFIEDETISETSVVQTLVLKKAQVASVCEVLDVVHQCVLTLGKPHVFRTLCILFLQELFACQKDFTDYFSQLAGSGREMKELVTHSYRPLVLLLVEAVQGFSALNDRTLIPALSCVQTWLLHLLDMSWEAEDLSLFLDIRLPDLLFGMCRENIGELDSLVHESFPLNLEESFIGSSCRYLESYNHNYSWLLFTALSLFTSQLVSEKEQDGERLDDITLGHACALQRRCFDLTSQFILNSNLWTGESKRDPITVNFHRPYFHECLAECYGVRFLGLLAALSPAIKQGCTWSLSSTSLLLPVLVRAVISNRRSTHEVVSIRCYKHEIYHQTLGLLGRLLLRISPADADAAVSQAQTGELELLPPGDGAASAVTGWKTTRLLFSLGAACLDSQQGLDWTCSLAEILRSLMVCSQWSAVVAAFTDHCVHQFPQLLKRTVLFTLLVLVGFPEVLFVGAESVQHDIANKRHNVMVPKHEYEWNIPCVVVDVKTRERRKVPYKNLFHAEESHSDRQDVSPTFLTHHLKIFTSIVTHLLQEGVESSTQDAVEASWLLWLALKGLYNTLKKLGVDQAWETIQDSSLMPLLVRQCSKSTGFSQTVLLPHLEICSMLWFFKTDRRSAAEDTVHSAWWKLPLNDMDEEIKICFQAKPPRCEKAAEETDLSTQKRVLKKNQRCKFYTHMTSDRYTVPESYLIKVNEAIAVLSARRVLAALLVDWPCHAPVREEELELRGASHMAYILHKLMKLETRSTWQKILQKVFRGCSQSMLGILSLTGCQFMEGQELAVLQLDKCLLKSTNLRDKVCIPEATFLRVEIDSSYTFTKAMDRVLMSTNSDFQPHLLIYDRATRRAITHFEIPGDTLYYWFTSNRRETYWGYRFTVTGGQGSGLGRFQTGFEILKLMLADRHALPLADIWERLVGVACRQTGSHRLKAIHLLLRILRCSSQWDWDFTLLKPLWQLYAGDWPQDPKSVMIHTTHQSFVELFSVAEAKAMDQGVLMEYILALTRRQ